MFPNRVIGHRGQGLNQVRGLSLFLLMMRFICSDGLGRSEEGRGDSSGVQRPGSLRSPPAGQNRRRFGGCH